MLRTQPADVHDQWVTNEFPFDDERVVAAIDEFGYFARNDAYVASGAGAFWTGMVDYAGGGKDAKELAKAIQDSWDALK